MKIYHQVMGIADEDELELELKVESETTGEIETIHVDCEQDPVEEYLSNDDTIQEDTFSEEESKGNLEE